MCIYRHYKQYLKITMLPWWVQVTPYTLPLLAPPSDLPTTTGTCARIIIYPLISLVYTFPLKLNCQMLAFNCQMLVSGELTVKCLFNRLTQGALVFMSTPCNQCINLKGIWRHALSLPTSFTNKKSSYNLQTNTRLI